VGVLDTPDAPFAGYVRVATPEYTVVVKVQVEPHGPQLIPSVLLDMTCHDHVTPGSNDTVSEAVDV
jgi:hypothetical protein